MRTTSQEEGGAGLVFLVASHKNPTQVARLVARLAADLPEAAIVVHHDQSKSPLSRSQLPACADLMDTFVAATWGTASLAEISTSGLAYIARRYHDYRWVVFLSGQDYPVRGLRTLPAQLASMKDGYIDVESPSPCVTNWAGSVCPNACRPLRCARSSSV
jgi:hypothetical protein